MSSIQPYGVEVTETDIAELRESGELKYRYATDPDEDDVEVVLKYDDDGGGDDDGNGGAGHRVDAPLS
jgi:hypothetical protein